ncbi:MAG: ribosomal protein S18-alanine N-acetyltransferase, partial [Pseudomonadota bacterium]|nr:ribosomal protein S18-alanine N-acetyltransferase [Pseudomonadota bacterium]
GKDKISQRGLALSHSERDSNSFSLEKLRKTHLPIVWDMQKSEPLITWSERQFVESYDNVYVLLSGNKEIVGFTVILENPPDAEIHNLFICNELRGRGLGKILFKQAIQMLSAEVENLYLEVSEDNNIAIALYKSLGFEEIGARKNYYGKASTSSNAIIMHLLI